MKEGAILFLLVLIVLIANEARIYFPPFSSSEKFH